MGSGQLPIAWETRMGSGQLPIAWEILIGSGQLPMLSTVLTVFAAGAAETTAGAAAENARAPAKATAAAIFFNIIFPQCESDSLRKLRGPC